jgi:hypothetical protein
MFTVLRGGYYPTFLSGLFSSLEAVLFVGSGIGSPSFLSKKYVNGRVFGLAIAYHTLSLAIEQLEIKVIALQWIFGTPAYDIIMLIVAFVISGVVALLSVLVMIPQFRRTIEDVTAETQASVDHGVDETSRLLGGQS